MNLDYVRVYHVSGNYTTISPVHHELLKTALKEFHAGTRTGADIVLDLPNPWGGENTFVLSQIDSIHYVTIDELEEVWNVQVEYDRRKREISPEFNWEN